MGIVIYGCFCMHALAYIIQYTLLRIEPRDAQFCVFGDEDGSAWDTKRLWSDERISWGLLWEVWILLFGQQYQGRRRWTDTKRSFIHHVVRPSHLRQTKILNKSSGDTVCNIINFTLHPLFVITYVNLLLQLCNCYFPINVTKPLQCFDNSIKTI